MNIFNIEELESSQDKSSLVITMSKDQLHDACTLASRNATTVYEYLKDIIKSSMISEMVARDYYDLEPSHHNAELEPASAEYAKYGVADHDRWGAYSAEEGWYYHHGQNRWVNPGVSKGGS